MKPRERRRGWGGEGEEEEQEEERGKYKCLEEDVQKGEKERDTVSGQKEKRGAGGRGCGGNWAKQNGRWQEKGRRKSCQ